MGHTDRQPDLRLEMASHPKLLSAARAMITNYAGRVGFDENEAGQIALALDEALSNIINHGYGCSCGERIWVTVRHFEAGDESGIEIVVEDTAKQVDPGSIRSRDLDDIRPGGLGVYLIRHIMDEVNYECRSPCGMRLTMVKRMHAKPDISSGEAPDEASQPCAKPSGMTDSEGRSPQS